MKHMQVRLQCTQKSLSSHIQVVQREVRLSNLLKSMPHCALFCFCMVDLLMAQKSTKNRSGTIPACCAAKIPLISGCVCMCSLVLVWTTCHIHRCANLNFGAVNIGPLDLETRCSTSACLH